MINQEFGARFRISALLTQNRIFAYTDNDEHKWIENFCKTCLRCVRECPTGEIYEESKEVGQYIEGIGQHKRASDLYKCHTMHSKTIGCSICLKVCPFSNGINTYKKLKALMEG